MVHDAGSSWLVTELRKTPSDISGASRFSRHNRPRSGKNQSDCWAGRAPAGFDADLAANKQPELTIYVNNEKTVFEQAAFHRLLDQLIRSFANQPEPARLVWVDVDKDANAETRLGTRLDQIVLPLLLILTFGMTGGTVSSQLWIYLAVLLSGTVIVFFTAAWALHRRS